MKAIHLITTVFAWGLLLAARPSPAAGTPKVLFDFDGKKSSTGWVAVNDNVMGGVSRGGHTLTETGSLVFRGSLSLENNGGFSSIRTQRKRTDLSGYDGLEVRVRGDGRTYWLTINTNLRIPAGSYRVLIPTKAGQWQTVRAPFSSFKATSFGRVLPLFVPVSRSKIESIGFLIADKKAGPFRLEVDWVRAVPKASAVAAGPRAVAGPTGSAGPSAEAQPKDIVEAAVAAGSFKTLAAALQAAGLVDTLKGDGPFTVFAPTDEAFAKLPAGTVENLLKPENRKRLIAVLTYHVVPGRYPLGARALTTVEGSPLAVTTGTRLGVNGATVTTPNIPASNGLIHVIDTVLLPKPKTPRPAEAAKELIELAIRRGVPVFNAGNVAACQAIYEVAAEALLRQQPSPLTDADRKTLRAALAQTAGSQNPRKNAWTLRRALDRLYARL